MVELDELLDQDPTKERVARLAELRIRNLMCFSELQSLNDTGTFRLEHPLIRQYSLRAELEEMLRRNPAQFLDEFRNVSNNVARYKSFLNRDKKDKAAAEKWGAQLTKHIEREQLMKEILSQKTDERNNHS